MELYDLKADPGETTDVAFAANQVVLDEMAWRLAGEFADRPSHADLAMDRATRERLEAMGYAWTDSTASRAERPDPRQRIHVGEQVSEATARFSRGDRDGGIAAMREVLAADSANAMVARRLAVLLWRDGRYAEAADAYGQAAALDPTDASLSDNRGAALERAGRPQEALEAYGAALAIEPGNHTARVHRWRLLNKLERYDELQRELFAVLAHSPSDGEARVLSLQLQHRDKPPEALVTALERTNQQFPHDPYVAEALASALLGIGRVDDATAAYERLVELDPGNYAASVYLARLALGSNQPTRARALLEAARPRQPDAPTLLVLLAEARARIGDHDGAVDLLDHAAALAPTDPEVWITSGTVWLSTDPGRAAALYERALALGSEEPFLLRNLAQAYDALGRTADAAAIRARAQTNGP